MWTTEGAVRSELLGRTLMHEHVFILSPEAVRDYPAVTGWDEHRMVDSAREKLRQLAQSGFSTIVDMTVLGMGRDVGLVARAARGTGVRVVVSTGVYVDDELPRFLRLRGPGLMIDEADPITDMLIRDVEDGIGDTGVRAGVIKCVTDVQGLTTGVERAVRAAADAHLATGAPLSTHADARTRRGLDQQRVFAEMGVDLSTVLIGHCGDSTDLTYLRTLLDAGSFIGMDRFGMDRGPYPSLDQRIDTVVKLCELGYSTQLVLSHDAHCWMDWLPDDLVAGTRAELPDWHFLHLPHRVIPALVAHGLDPDVVEAMLVENPKRILEGTRSV
ncbi:phosphotriesterase-related protein [Nocardioides hungaricus]